MPNSSDIVTGLRVSSQIPLDYACHKTNEAALANLGANNNLAYTYHKGQVFYAAAEETRWEWREPRFTGEAGLMPVNFTYTNDVIVNGIDYSLKKYNFFPYIPLEANNFQNIIDTLNVSIGWKNEDDENKQIKNPEDLPKKVTNNGQPAAFHRNGFVGYVDPIEELGLLKYPDYDPGNGNPTVNASTLELDILNLIVNISSFDLIRNYQPKLVISRYTPSRIKTRKLPKLKPDGVTYYPSRVRTTAKYKIATQESNIRPNKIPLSQGLNVVDFGQEHYFRTTLYFQEDPDGEHPEIIFCPRGIGIKGSNYNISAAKLQAREKEHYAFVYLQLHIEITVEGIKYLSVPLSRFKMGLIRKLVSTRIQIKYKNL